MTNMRRSFPVSECTSNSKNKKSSAELHAPDYIPLGLRDEGNGKGTNFDEGDLPMPLLPNHESNIPTSESIKLVDDLSSSKRPRINYLETSTRNVRADDGDITFQKDVSASVQCTYPEKNRVVKKKRGIEDKKTDKKNFRSSVRSRYDSTSKACFGSGDSTSRGNDILGSHGLKSDLSDVMKHVDDLDLTELLEGSYKYSNTCPARGKKSSNANENILLSIRKVISILPSPFAASTTNNEKGTVGLLKPTAFPSNFSNCDSKDNVTDASISTSKGPYSESCTLFTGSREILQHLALPSGLLLDSLLDPNPIPVPSNTLQNSQSASLPSFPWSNSHVGGCKSNGETAKQVSARNLCPSRWFRIEIDSFSFKDNQNYLVDLKVETLTDKGVIDQNHEDFVIHRVDSSKPPYDSVASKVQPVSTSPTGIHSLDVRPSGTISEKLMNVPMDFSFMHKKYDHGDIALSRTSEEETSLRNWQDDSPITVEMGSAVVSRENADCPKDQHTRNSKGYSISGCFYPEDVSTKLERSSWKSREICKTGNTPEVLLAAEILTEMARCPKSVKSHLEENRRVKLALPPLYKTGKAPKFLCSVQRSESYFSKTKHHDHDKSSDLSSIGTKPNGKKSDLKYMKSIGRDHIRCPAPLDYGISPFKLEKNVQVSQQPLHNLSVRPSSLISSKHPEQDVNHREKLAKKTLIAANGTLIKDWNKGRSKRV